ncbi:hypothetical protein ACFOEE_17915 [Pseudoalteromonas fenneropenaei]|uniref:IrrE N-terminal-like domain-containing protein n=1 Tax=Pseudoalteromonas fenneropenaei TaxID=1737459 RepID=A0ABV7CPE7_9GAMM
MDPIVKKLTDFLATIAIPFELRSIECATFLPGLCLEHGKLLIDLDKLKYPGDILHEAGHIAVCEPKERHLLHGDVFKFGTQHGRKPGNMHGEEMAATAWAVAAIQYLQLPLELVFHEAGYRGASNNLIEAFARGDGFGFPLLNAWLMTDEERGYPHMQRWVREVSWA